MSLEKIYIFDTTLRDGEQSAGIIFTPEEKLQIALQLESLQVDVIEAGFPCSSKGDLSAVKKISSTIKNSTVCALARSVKKDIDIAWEAISKAVDPRIHVFINSSDIQMAHQLGKNKNEVLLQAKTMVAHAAKYTKNIEFSPMDATRSDIHFLCEIIKSAIDAGATTINIPDSVGYIIPEELAVLFQTIQENVPNIHKVRLSFHGQNDLGLSTANSLTAIQNGARQVEVTINGIGERAGNTSLEEVVMAIHTRKDFFKFSTEISIKQIYQTSKLVESYSGMPVQWNKAIVGKNAFRHGSGIHQDGILKLRETWEIMDPKELGIPQGTQLVMGKLSGSHAFKNHLKQLGYSLQDNEFTRVFSDFKELADKKSDIDDRDIIAILNSSLHKLNDPHWILEAVQVSTGSKPTATITLKNKDKKTLIDAAIGEGPVDAIYQCTNRITKLYPTLTEFHVKSVTEGIDAQGEVTIHIQSAEKNIFKGKAAHTDILYASASAYVSALNRMLLHEENLP